jgi:hypothetical protein
MGFLGSLFSSVVPKLFSGLFGQKQAPVSTVTSLSPSAGGQSETDTAGEGKGFLQGLWSTAKDSFSDSVGDAVSAWSGNALGVNKMNGQAQKNYMDAAYPGTTPWEQLGSGGGAGAFAQGAVAGQQIKQQDKAVNLQAQTQLSTARIQAGQMFGTELLRQGVKPSDAMELMMKSGAFTGQPVNMKNMGATVSELRKGEIAAQTQHIQAQTDTERERPAQVRADTKVSESTVFMNAARTNQIATDIDLSKFDRALSQWKAMYGNSYLANEARALDNMASNTLRSWANIVLPKKWEFGQKEGALGDMLLNGLSEAGASNSELDGMRKILTDMGVHVE